MSLASLQILYLILLSDVGSLSLTSMILFVVAMSLDRIHMRAK
jgi:hypothetical protein